MQGVKQWTLSTANGKTGQLLPQRITRTAVPSAASQQPLVEPYEPLPVSLNSQPKIPISPQLGISKRHLLAFSCSCCVGLHLQQKQAAAADSGGTFSYDGSSGPSSWPGVCQTGTQQSPINLTLSQAAECDSRTSPAFRYQLSSNAQVKNTGTTLQVNLPAGSNSASWAGRGLQLLQYHFHTPSEHTLEGRHADMEVHLVHRDVQTGGLTVLAVMLNAAAPADQQQQQPPNMCLAAGLAAVPSTPGDSAACPVPVNPSELLPQGDALQQYVFYQGSLTTPPCSEDVRWLVWTQPVVVPLKQVQQFREFAHMNARPVQQLNSREVVRSCLTA